MIIHSALSASFNPLVRTIDAAAVYHVTPYNHRWGYWHEDTPGLPLLINSSPRAVKGGFQFEYSLDTFQTAYAGVHFEYTLGGVDDASFSDSAAAADSYTTLRVLIVAFAESGAIADSYPVARYADALFEERGVLTLVSVGYGVVLASFTSEAVIHSGGAAIGEDPIVWAFNADTFAGAPYSHFNFNSFAVVGGRYYGATDEGIFELTGEDDDGEPIEASVMLPSTDFDSSVPKQIQYLYLSSKSESPFRVRSVTDDGQVREYASSPSQNGETATDRVTMSRGVKSQYWQFEIANIEGEDFVLDKVEALVMPLQRRKG